MNILNIFNRFQGLWNLERTILSKNPSSPSGEVKGTAVFTQITNDVFLYQETGEFATSGDRIFKVQNEYLYRYRKEQNKIEKYFIEQNHIRFFYQLEFNNSELSKYLSATGEHLCNKDSYRANYLFLENEEFNAFILSYLVNGSKKEYQVETKYTRNLSAFF